MAIPTYDALMLPVLTILANDKLAASSDIVNQLAISFKLTEEEKNRMYSSGKNTLIFSNRIGWARTYLKKAGLITYPKRGHSQITSEGLKLLESRPQKIDLKLLMQYPTFREFVTYTKHDNHTGKPNPEPQQTPDEMIALAKETLEGSLKADLIDRILNNEAVFFEKMVADLLCKMGYGGSMQDILQNYGKSGDGGIDCIIKQDALGLDQVHIQAKRYKRDNIVQVGSVRDFCGALYGKKNPKGVFITTSSFSKGAADYAANNDLILIDGKRLTELMLTYNVGVQTREIIEIKKIDEDYFLEEE